MFGKLGIHLCLSRLEFDLEVLVTVIVEGTLSTTSKSEKSVDMINQVGVTILPYSKYIIMVKTDIDTSALYVEPVLYI